MNKTLLTETDLSLLIGVPVKTLRYWRFAGTTFVPKFIKLGARVYYPKDDLDKWLSISPRFSKVFECSRGAFKPIMLCLINLLYSDY